MLRPPLKYMFPLQALPPAQSHLLSLGRACAPQAAQPPRPAVLLLSTMDLTVSMEEQGTLVSIQVPADETVSRRRPSLLNYLPSSQQHPHELRFSRATSQVENVKVLLEVEVRRTTPCNGARLALKCEAPHSTYTDRTLSQRTGACIERRALG